MSPRPAPPNPRSPPPLHHSRRRRAFHPPSDSLSALALPTAAAPPTTCHHCLTTSASKLLPCSACRAVSYCSKACQRASWKLVHKAECPALKNVPSDRLLPTPVRALVQVATRRDVWNAVMVGLVGNEAGFRGGGGWADLKMQGEMVRILMGGREGEWIGGGDVGAKYAVAMCKLLTNMFNVHDPDLGYDAVFLDGGLAMANHSCMPNASAHIYGRTAILVADEPIGADEETNVSSDTSYPLAQRQLELEKYHFVCKCTRCTSDLNVYQAARLLPASTVQANAFSLLRNPSHLAEPPAAASPPGPAAGTKLQSAIYEALDALAEPSPVDADATPLLRSAFRICEPLTRDSLWAMLPPSLVTQCLTHYLSREDHVGAFLVTCLAACRIHPYGHPSPANPFRLKGALALCRALSNAAADRSIFASRVRDVHARTRNVGPQGPGDVDVDVDVLADLDAVATARMVFDMLAHYVAVTQVEGWPLEVQVKQGLEAVRGIPWGMDGGRKVMEEWERREGGEGAWLGIWKRMVELLDGMAELGARLLLVDFAS
ncbi:hypothetical protein jhhlp_001099 [Lomentospora prolificans]|uniref:MYND-type domain-containing protein n=1 Tax=Lomentospora prolificans TaxID=41688 RepID=A0A2N3NH59_9PEZI|nr:hypothetical protein jhhlp_001099 [Lomentospora prolificans]